MRFIALSLISPSAWRVRLAAGMTLVAWLLLAQPGLVGVAKAEFADRCSVSFNSEASLRALDPVWQQAKWTFADGYKECGIVVRKASNVPEYHLMYEGPVEVGECWFQDGRKSYEPYRLVNQRPVCVEPAKEPRYISPHDSRTAIEIIDEDYWSRRAPFELWSLYVRSGSVKVVVAPLSGRARSYTVSGVGLWTYPGRNGDRNVKSVKLQAIGNLFEVDDVVISPPNLVGDPGFEKQTSEHFSTPWRGDGPDTKGVATDYFAHSGRKSAVIQPDELNYNWNAVAQPLLVSRNTNYVLTGYIMAGTDLGMDGEDYSYVGKFGVVDNTGTVVAETSFWAIPRGFPYTRFVVRFNSGSNDIVTVFAGYWATGVSSWLILDDVAIRKSS